MLIKLLEISCTCRTSAGWLQQL